MVATMLRRRGDVVGRRRPSPTLGQSTVGATPGNLNANYQLGSKFTSTGSVYVARIRAYLDGAGPGVGAQLLKATIYTGNAGNTTNGTLQATSAEVSIADGQAAGWVDFAFATPPTIAAGTYWLNLLLGTVSATARIYRDATASGSGYFADTYSDGPVASGGTYILETGVMSIYTVATAGSGVLFSDGSAVVFSDASTVNFGS